jgi:hypothetical protein
MQCSVASRPSMCPWIWSARRRAHCVLPQAGSPHSPALGHAQWPPWPPCRPLLTPAVPYLLSPTCCPLLSPTCCPLLSPTCCPLLSPTCCPLLCPAIPIFSMSPHLSPVPEVHRPGENHGLATPALLTHATVPRLGLFVVIIVISLSPAVPCYFPLLSPASFPLLSPTYETPEPGFPSPLAFLVGLYYCLT